MDRAAWWRSRWGTRWWEWESSCRHMCTDGLATTGSADHSQLDNLIRVMSCYWGGSLHGARADAITNTKPSPFPFCAEWCRPWHVAR
jgi:hypothetical protein